jgi:uncharacterized protein (DUF427 family)
MSLTIGTGPFGDRPAGAFNFEPPDRVVYTERLPRRVRAERGGRVVIDSDAVMLVHESGRLPYYAIPSDDVADEVSATPAIEVNGHVVVAWDAVDAWYEEDELVEVHPRDPYHRIDTFATSRRITVRVGEAVLADSTRARALYETGLPVRWYLPIADVRTDLLEPSDTVTECAYKGRARHWCARVGGELVPDVAWAYDEAVREGEPVKGLIAFYDERVDINAGALRRRPHDDRDGGERV